jgi:hypothetical protein
VAWEMLTRMHPSKYIISPLISLEYILVEDVGYPLFCDFILEEFQKVPIELGLP